MTDFRFRLALSHNNLGMLTAFPGSLSGSFDALKATGKPTEAEAELRRVLEILEKLAADHPAVTDFRSKLAVSHIGLGTLLSQTGKPTEAEAELRRALEISQKLAVDNPKVPTHRDLVAMVSTQLADLALARGRLAEARDGYDRAIALEEQWARDDPKTPIYRPRRTGKIIRNP